MDGGKSASERKNNAPSDTVELYRQLIDVLFCSLQSHPMFRPQKTGFSFRPVAFDSEAHGNCRVTE